MRKYLWVIGLMFLGLVYAGFQVKAQEAVVNPSVTIHEVNGRPYHFHAVVQGQTLFSIAKAYGVSQQDIIDENPELRHGLKYEQIILIPVADSSEQKAESGDNPPRKEDNYKHVVARGETLYGISKKYDVSIEELLQANPEARKGLKPGQMLVIPSVAEKETFRHVVSQGETLYSISAKFNVSVDEIFSVNPSLTTDIQPGQSIRIPLKKDIFLPENQEPQMRQGLVFVTPEMRREQVSENETSDCFDIKLKEEYNVALFIPLYLEELDSISEIDDISPLHKSFTFLDYYYGVLIALDSVRTTTGTEITLHVFDVDQSLEKANQAVKTPGFSSMDLIIGPFFPQTLSFVAGYGLRNDIPVVSPLLDDNKLLKGFPNLFQVTPSMETQLEELAAYLAFTFPDQNIVLVHNQQKQAEKLISGFKKDLSEGIKSALFFQDSLNLARVNGYFISGSLVGNRRTNVLVMNDSVFQVRSPEVDPADYFRENPLKEVIFSREGVEGVIDVLQENEKNVIVTLMTGEAFLSDYLRQLNHDSTNYDMVIFGTPQWQDYQNIEADYLQNLNVHIFTPDFIDYASADTRGFIKRYREVFEKEPESYAFKGVKTAWFFFNALVNYGSEFSECIHHMNESGIQDSFNFERISKDENHGWENKKSTLFRYKNYRKVEVEKNSDNTSQADI